MEQIKINPTPVRTSQNYHVNEMVLPWTDQEERAFHGCSFQEFDNEAIMVKEIVSPFTLSYGNGEVLEKQVKEKANVTYSMEVIKNSEKENLIFFSLQEEDPVLIDAIELIVKEDCSAKVTFFYTSDYTNSKENHSFYHNGVLRIQLRKNAKLQCTLVNLLGEETQHFIAIENTLEENAQLEMNMVDFGGNSSVTNYYTNLKEENAQNELNTIYLGNHQQCIDINYIVTTKGKNTKVNMDVQGAIKDNCCKHFKGTIDFQRGSKKAEGNENEFCMLLSDDAKSISLPMLLCDEEDVIGNHATAAGKVNQKEIFYLMSRGLTEQDAKALLVRAKFDKVLAKISSEEIRDKVECYINQKLETEEICHVSGKNDCHKNR